MRKVGLGMPRYLDSMRKFVPRPAKRIARQALSVLSSVKARARLAVGVEPLRKTWGERGQPLHRMYLERFLEECATDIHGHCAEFQEDSYTSRFGGCRVVKIDILHKDKGNPRATIIADLTKENSIPSNVFDCIICTYVFHIIFEMDKMIAELYRILKPGGILIVAAPDITSNNNPQYHELWRFTAEGLHLLLAKAFGMEHVTVRTYGNSLIAAGELRGLVKPEFTKAELDYHDPRFAILVCARAVKKAEAAKSRQAKCLTRGRGHRQGLVRCDPAQTRSVAFKQTGNCCDQQQKCGTPSDATGGTQR
jgi:SAM-dependent methyltransferase